MKPLVIEPGSRHRSVLSDLAFELAQKSAGFRRSVPGSLLPPLADLARSINCYHTNLSEGYDTHPVDIGCALENDYSADPRQRDPQREARAHVEHRWIDAGSMPRRSFQCLFHHHNRPIHVRPDQFGKFIRQKIVDPHQPGAIFTFGKHLYRGASRYKPPCGLGVDKPAYVFIYVD
jgi:hypothetical protein